MNKAWYVVLVLFVIAFFWSLTQFKTEKNNTVLRVGTSYDYPPYTYMQDGAIVGFDIDLIEHVAKQLDKKVEIVGMPFSALIFSLFGNEVDVLASAMSPTPRRAKYVSFSDVYLQGDPLVVISKKNAAYCLHDLSDKRVVVNTGFVADTFMSNKPTKDLVRLKTPADAILALQSGSVDAWVSAKSSACSLLSKIKNASDFTLCQIQDTADDYAFVVSPHNKDLVCMINQALDVLHTAGTIQELKTKWGIE